MRHEMTKNKKTWIVSTTILCPFVLWSSGGFAETTSPLTRGGLEEIVVTSQKRAESLQAVPIAVSALTSDTLTANVIDSQITLPQLTPNMQIQGLVNYVSPYLRGVGTSFANPGLEQTVAVYLDDAYLSRSSSGLFSFTDIERVEVLKGPQGTLYGRNSPAGAIRIITKQPTKDLEAGASFTIGNYDRKDYAAYLSGPVAPTLSARVSVNYNTRDGYVTRNNPSLPKLNDRDELVILGKLLWEPNDRLSVKLALDYANKDDFAGSAFIPVFNKAPEQTGIAVGGASSTGFYHFPGDGPHTKNGTFNEADWGAQLRIDYEADAYTLSSISTFRSLDLKHGVADLDTTDIPMQHYWQSQWTKDYTQEFQAVSDNTGRLNWVAGVYILHEDTEFDGGVFGTAVFGTPEILFASHARVEVDSVAPYGQASYQITDQFELTLGARYTIESKKLKFSEVYFEPFDAVNEIPSRGVGRTYLTGTPGDNNLIFGSNPDTLSFKSFTPRVVLSYAPHDNTLFYLSYSKGFKSGGYNVPAFYGAQRVLPENLNSYELGWKTEFGQVRFNGSAFYYDYKDIQVAFTSQENNGSVVENAANAKIKGIEAELTWAATDLLELGFGGGYLHSKYEDFETASIFVRTDGSNGTLPAPACADAVANGGDTAFACSGFYAINPVNLSGNKLVYAPKWNGYFRAQYIQPLANLGSLAFNGVVSYSSKYFHDSSNFFVENERVMINASITWFSANEHFSVTAFGENLTNRNYNLQRTFQELGGWRVPGPPRFYGLRLSAKY